MKKITVSLCGTLLAAIGFAESGTLTLEQALELSRQHSPELRAARIHSQAADKGIAAAGLWVNPVLEFEAEGVGWDNDLFSEGEYTLGLMQKFQRGGKQKKERAVAFQAAGVVKHTLSEKELEWTAQVRRAFIQVLALQESGKVQADQEELGRAFVEVAKRRYQSGAGSELEVVQAELALEEILFSQTCCLGELVAARETLASLIGLPEKELDELAGPYYELEAFEGLVVDRSHPILLRMNAEVDRLRAEAQWAKSKDTADIKLGAGYKYEAAGEINTLVFAASMPLSFHKQGRAEQAAGLLRADAVQAEGDEMHRKLQAQLAEALALYKGARAQAAMGRDRLIPKAEKAYDLSRTGYEAGRFSWMELIVAQQHLADIRIGYIEALQEAHLARLDILKFKKEGI